MRKVNVNWGLIPIKEGGFVKENGREKDERTANADKH